MQPPPYPQVSGTLKLTDRWAIELPCPFYRRTEDGDLVLWRTGPQRVTAWVAVWGPTGDTADAVLAWIKSEGPAEPLETHEWERDGLLRYGYLLAEREEGEEGERWALYTFTIGAVPAGTAYVQMAIYADRRDDLALAQLLWRGVRLRSDAT